MPTTSSTDDNRGHVRDAAVGKREVRFSEMVDRVEHTHDRIVVTRNGRPAAVMISPDDLASLEDTLALLSDTDAMEELAEARRAHADGDYVTGDELRASLSAT